MSKHPLYQLCYSAHSNISFRPEKRAESYCAGYDAELAELKELCGDDLARYSDIEAKYTAKFKAWMYAKSRCLSSMITGPANFPVRRAEKANNSEHARSVELSEFVAKVKKAIDKEKNPNKYGISSDAPNAIQLLKNKLEGLQAGQETMKACNAIIRNKKLSDAEKRAELLNYLHTDERVAEILKPDFCGRIGFASYSLTNNLANIKTTQARIAELEAKEGKTNKEELIKGVRALHNYEENRLQLFFEGKPDEKTRASLKSWGFKWSPTNSAWQRLLNGNAVYAAKQFFEGYNNGQ